MKKIFTLAVMSAAMMSASAYNHVKLTFSNIAGSSATVSVVDENGDAISGASAELVSIGKGNGTNAAANSSLKAGGLVPTYGILSPDYGNQVGNWWTLTFKISGIEDFEFNNIDADAYALTANGGTQTADSKKWKIDYQWGAAADALNAWGTCPAEEFVVGYYNAEEGRCHHTMNANVETSTTLDGDTYVSIKMTKTQGGGCHSGIASLDFYYVAPAAKANVTYKYVVDGTPIAYTTSSEQTVGQAPAEPAGYDFATVTSDAASKTVAADGSTVVTVQVAQQLPFSLSDKDDQSLHRGFLHVQSNQGRYMYFDWDDDAEAMMVYDTGYYEPESIKNEKLTMDFPNSASTCQWHITGNVVEGFKLYDETYDFVLAATAPQATMLSLYDEANGENPGTAFVLKRSTAGVGKFNFKRGFCLYAPEREQYLNAQKQMMYWKDADAGSTFEFEESFDVTIGQEGLATLYYHTPLSLEGTGLEAFSLALEGDYLVAEYGSSYVPAYTGVVLAGDPGDYTLPIFFENFHGGSALTGSYKEQNTPENCYVLSKDGDDVCFAKYTGAKVGEFKAYFVGEATSASNLRVSFGELTNIISAAKANGGRATYDLQGRRVVNAKGVNIVDGKKVIR